MPSQMCDRDWVELKGLYRSLGSWAAISRNPGRSGKFAGIPAGTLSTMFKTKKIPRKWVHKFARHRTPPVRVGECTESEWAIIKNLTPQERKERLLGTAITFNLDPPGRLMSKEEARRDLLGYERSYPFESCGCALCELIHDLLSQGSIWLPWVWQDPRRFYLESESDFLKRVPDGFLRWPEDHKNIIRERL